MRTRRSSEPAHSGRTDTAALTVLFQGRPAAEAPMGLEGALLPALLLSPLGPVLTVREGVVVLETGGGGALLMSALDAGPCTTGASRVVVLQLRLLCWLLRLLLGRACEGCCVVAFCWEECGPVVEEAPTEEVAAVCCSRLVRDAVGATRVLGPEPSDTPVSSVVHSDNV